MEGLEKEPFVLLDKRSNRMFTAAGNQSPRCLLLKECGGKTALRRGETPHFLPRMPSGASQAAGAL